MTDPAKFIDRIWTLQQRSERPRYGFVSHKDWETGEWTDHALRNGKLDLPDSGGLDLYFAPVLFAKGRRLRQHALPSRWLYADLDEVDPRGLGDLPPTVAWETSPGRYQALWKLDRPLSVDRFERLNKRLTYHVGADLGGWSATKVLRVPGSVSTKYGRSRAKRWQVAVIGGVGPSYSVQDLQALLPKLGGGKRAQGQLFGDLDSLPLRGEVLEKWRAKLPIRARKLLSTKNVVRGDDRSARLWELYNLLLQAGMSPTEVLVSVQGTVWNKYAGQRRELDRLTTEIEKAAAKHAEASELERLRTQGEARGRKRGPKGAVARKLEKRRAASPKMLPFLTNSEFMQQSLPEPQWLVEGIWAKDAYGLWAGEYKSYKTVALLDLAVSVASGTPFLGRFKVHETGGVLYLHEEGAPGLVRDRLHRMENERGLAAVVQGNGRAGGTVMLGPENLDHLRISSFPGFKINDEDSREKLENYCDEYRPRLVILETFYLIASDVDENKATEVAPTLEYLASVARKYGTALIVSHHYNKGSGDKEGGGGGHTRAIRRISGSGVFARWYESAVLMERVGEEDDYRARMETTHRSHKGAGQVDLQFEIDVEDEDQYRVVVFDKANSTMRTPEEPVGGDPGEVELRDLDASGPTHKERILGRVLKKALVVDGQAFVTMSDLRAKTQLGYKRAGKLAREAGYDVVQLPVARGGGLAWCVVREGTDAGEEG